MNTLIIVIGTLAVAGVVFYLAVRSLVAWDRWREEQAQAREVRHRLERRQHLRDEAAASTLRQLAQREEAVRGVGRKAA